MPFLIIDFHKIFRPTGHLKALARSGERNAFSCLGKSGHPMVGCDDSREKHRWGESKVYMRKGHGKASKSGLNPQNMTAEGQMENGSIPHFMEGSGRFDAVSDDSSSLNRKQISVNHHDAPNEGGCRPPVEGLSKIDTHVTINLASYSKQEIRELRRKLINELEQVRSVFKKLEAREVQLRGYSFSAGGINASYSASQFSGNDMRNNGGKEVTSEVASGGAITPRQAQRESKPVHQLSISVVENNQAASDIAEKGKRTPKANQYYRKSEFVLGKDKFPPSESKKSKSAGNKKSIQPKINMGETAQQGEDFPFDKIRSEVFKQCSSLLTKLMKHKHGWIFNTPVDVKGLGLHDYHAIIKKPMDLGTVKSKLDANRYDSPTEFAEDVRLTFSNAMTYNPKGHEVHSMAEQLLHLFEERWKTIYREPIVDKMKMPFGNEQTPGVSQNVKKFPSQDLKKNIKKSEPAGGPSPVKPKSTNNPASRTPAPKKPKAKDLHKRDMTYEEKQKLSTNLQSLPAEKLEQLVQIIKKRNPSLRQHEEEIEVDIDSFDTETLWELDRFVTNYKKSLSKNKKKAALADQAKRANECTGTKEKYAMTEVGETPKKNKREQGEEDVDIDDEMPSTNFPPVEIENNGGYASKSSSSSSSSSDSGSSSSDSDSGSSSGSESDAYATHSPCAGSKASPRG